MFTGYHQRCDEDPIGYRGTAAALSSSHSAAPRVASELEAAATSLAGSARTLAAPASRLRRH